MTLSLYVVGASMVGSGTQSALGSVNRSMSRPDGERIFGVETEFGCLVSESVGSPETAVEMIKDCIFYDLRLGALDLHSRDDVFEPAQCGGFLLNGGRMYIDAVGSHLEYATAECRSLRDLVANDRAGQRLIVRAINHLGMADEISVYNNSVDHFGGHTFGCHENYLVRADGDLLSESVGLLYPFLVTRQIYAGVGRVGGHILTGGLRPSYQDVMDNPIDYIWVSQVYGVVADDTVPFQLSQRADHILKTIASRVRFNRALINPKWEHFYSHDGMTRLHLLFGESNQNEYAYALKVGTTAIVLDLIEDGLAPEMPLANPLQALRDVSRDQEYRWLVELADGRTISSLDLHREYLKQALNYRGRSEQTDWVLCEWESILDGLERDPMSLDEKLDWVAKKKVVDQYSGMMASEQQLETSTGAIPDALHSVDLEFHNIDPAAGLYYGLQEMGQTERFVSEVDVINAMTEPPQDTRALGRSLLVKEVLKRKGPKFYVFDWNGVALDRNSFIEMPDPFETYGPK